jgi:DNA-binding CsgD family transcriptional regulator
MYELLCFHAIYRLTALQTLPPVICLLLLIGMAVFCGHSYLKNKKSRERFLLCIEQEKAQRLKNELLEAELNNKMNELMKQTSILTRKGLIMKTLIEELERQKEILGDNYPSSLYLRMKGLMEKVLNNDKDRIAFETYFNSAHRSFIERFGCQYEGITAGDMRFCCLLRMNLSTKEIAALLNISIRAVELRRYRLRKRIGLESDINLVAFLMNF